MRTKATIQNFHYPLSTFGLVVNDLAKRQKSTVMTDIGTERAITPSHG